MPNPTAKLKYKWQTGGNSCNTYNRLMVNSLTNQQGKNGKSKKKNTLRTLKLKTSKKRLQIQKQRGKCSVFLIKAN